MKSVNLKVNGMSCNHCVSAIEKAVGQLGASAKVDLSQHSVQVEFDDSKLSLAIIKEAIEDQGYDVV